MSTAPEFDAVDRAGARLLLVMTAGFVVAVVVLDVVLQAGRLTAFGSPAGWVVLAVLAAVTWLSAKSLLAEPPLQQTSVWAAVLALACAVFVGFPALVSLGS